MLEVINLAPAKTEILLDAGAQIGGIVHVGMNDAEEFPWYIHRGHLPLLGFEPQPDVYAEARRRFRDCDDVSMFCMALGDEEGMMRLQIPARHDAPTDEYLKSATLLEMVDGKALYQQPISWHEQYRFVRSVDVLVRRFDALVRDGQVDPAPYNTLVIDVEGFEMNVLRGFGDCLDGFQNLSVECSREPGFVGQAAAHEIADWLAERGFERITPIEEHNDVFFRRAI
jgi:FkbM family methyltransferase